MIDSIHYQLSVQNKNFPNLIEKVMRQIQVIINLLYKCQENGLKMQNALCIATLNTL